MLSKRFQRIAGRAGIIKLTIKIDLIFLHAAKYLKGGKYIFTQSSFFLIIRYILKLYFSMKPSSIRQSPRKLNRNSFPPSQLNTTEAWSLEEILPPRG